MRILPAIHPRNIDVVYLDENISAAAMWDCPDEKLDFGEAVSAYLLSSPQTIASAFQK